ncbi:MAG: hypothetical protein LIO45_02200, partial [Clostridiales bacterium]|nr:hypothetical protein [Clostridiales bacterium]
DIQGYVNGVFWERNSLAEQKSNLKETPKSSSKHSVKKSVSPQNGTIEQGSLFDNGGGSKDV